MIENLYKLHKKIIESTYIHKEHKDLYKQYTWLTAEEIDTLIDLIIEDKEFDIDNKRDIILYLVLYSYGGGEKLPRKLYDYLLSEKIYYYGELYLRADEEVAKELINKVNDEEEDINHLLCCIANIPCDETLKFFVESSKDPLPTWSKKLYVTPDRYTYCGKWYINRDGKIESLISNKVVGFERGSRKELSKKAPLKVLEEKCEFCGKPLILVFDNKEKYGTCLNCSCYQILFLKEEEGKLIWHKSNKMTEFFEKNKERFIDDYDIKFEFALKEDEEERKSTYTANEFAVISKSTIGGFPTEINQIDYPNCPECGDTMHFAAQLDCEDVQKYGEGIYYFFSCRKCSVRACNYGQS